jgi:hypothetical protein
VRGLFEEDAGRRAEVLALISASPKA